MGKIESINISKRKGVPKKPVGSASLLPGMGMEGDAHAAPGDRQLSLLMVEAIERQRAVLEERMRSGAAAGGPAEKTVELVPGIYAENLTTRGIDLTAVNIGDVLNAGEGIRLRVSKIGKECHTRCAIFTLVGDCVMPREGVFCEVIKGGAIRPGDDIEFG